MEVACRDSERELERIFERNMATHFSKQPARRQHCVKITCPIMKSDCSPFYLGCFTVHPVRLPLSLLIYTSPVYIWMPSYIASDNVIPENRLELFTVFYKDGLFCQYPMAG